jgi:hypothetical protein
MPLNYARKLPPVRKAKTWSCVGDNVAVFLAIFSQNETDCEATQVRIGVAVRDILEFFLPRLDFMIRGAEGWLKFGVSLASRDILVRLQTNFNCDSSLLVSIQLRYPSPGSCGWKSKKSTASESLTTGHGIGKPEQKHEGHTIKPLINRGSVVQPVASVPGRLRQLNPKRSRVDISNSSS